MQHPLSQTPTPIEYKPVFMPRVGSDNLVKTDMVRIVRHVGFATRQKKKTINDLHQVIKKKYGFKKVLDLTSKSGNKLSFHLNPNTLKLTHGFESDSDVNNNSEGVEQGRQYSVENAYQASKVFEKGGPFIDLLDAAPRQAKKDERLINFGDITGYDYFGMLWGLEPLTVFYDWLYVNALKQHPQLHEEVLQYQAFTDVSFNPKKNIHCPAYSLAMFVGLHKRELLDGIEDPGTFYDLVTGFDLSNTEDQLEEGWF